MDYICSPKSENSSVGRARPCQGRGRGFESRFSLNKREKVLIIGEGRGRGCRKTQIFDLIVFRASTKQNQN